MTLKRFELFWRERNVDSSYNTGLSSLSDKSAINPAKGDDEPAIWGDHHVGRGKGKVKPRGYRCGSAAVDFAQVAYYNEIVDAHLNVSVHATADGSLRGKKSGNL